MPVDRTLDARAREVPNPIDEAFSLFFAALCGVIEDHAQLAQWRAEELAALSLSHGLPMFAAMGQIVGLGGQDPLLHERDHGVVQLSGAG